MTATYTIYLFIAAWQDLRKKSVPVGTFIVFGVLGIIENLLWKEQEWGLVLWSMLPGLLLLLLTRCSGGAVGAGDGYFFVVSAFYLSAGQLVRLLCFGLILCTVWSMGIIMWGILRGISVRKKSLPFLPFLLPAWLWMLLL